MGPLLAAVAVAPCCPPGPCFLPSSLQMYTSPIANRYDAPVRAPCKSLCTRGWPGKAQRGTGRCQPQKSGSRSTASVDHLKNCTSQSLCIEVPFAPMQTSSRLVAGSQTLRFAFSTRNAAFSRSAPISAISKWTHIAPPATFAAAAFANHPRSSTLLARAATMDATADTTNPLLTVRTTQCFALSLQPL